MANILMVCLVGVAATSLMTFALYLLHWSGFASGDMVRSIGSAVTGRYQKSLGPGFVIHFSLGIIFSLLYVFVWSKFPDLATAKIWQYVGLGVFFGFAQGLVVSMLLVVFIAEYHPLQQFRVMGVGVALMHVLAHMVYGGTIGFLVGMLRLSL